MMKLKFILPMLALSAGSLFAQTELSTGLDKANMNLKAKPGTDFFEYAAGGWLKANPLTPEYARYSHFDALHNNNQKHIRELIEELAAGQHKQGTLEQKIGSLYRLAMDSVRRNKEDYAPIQETLNQVEAIQTRNDVQYAIAYLRYRSISSFFGFYCGADLEDAEWNLMQVGQGGISMGERDYYLGQDEATVKIREAYKKYVAKLFEMTGKTAAQSQESMEAVLRIETQLATAAKSATELRDIRGNYNKITYKQLLSDYPGIDWSTLFLLNGIPAFEKVSVNQPRSIQEVEKILAEAPIADLKAYLYFKVVNDAKPAYSLSAPSWSDRHCRWPGNNRAHHTGG